MKRLLIYVDASVVGGCDDEEFAVGSLALWRCFIESRFRAALSDLTLLEFQGAPPHVRKRIEEISIEAVVRIADSDEAFELAEEYLRSISDRALSAPVLGLMRTMSRWLPLLARTYS